MRCGRKAVSHLGYGFFGWLILKITLKKALGFFIKGVVVLGGPPRAALERREFKKVTLFYLALEVGLRKSIFDLRWFFQLN